MADLSDVLDTLVAMIGGVLYPNGSSPPATSIVGNNVRIYPGWPVATQLAADLSNKVNGAAAPIPHVSVYVRPEERNTTRYMDLWQQATSNRKTLTLAVEGQTVTVGGVIPDASNPHHVMIRVNGTPYPYLVQPTDSLDSIASELQTLVSAGVDGVTLSGSTLSFPPLVRIDAARVGITQTVVNEVRRQERVFQITAWANSPQLRTAIAVPVDTLLAKTRRFVLPDTTVARLIYKGSLMTDANQNQQVYRRDLLYTVEYATLDTDIASEITQEQINVSADVGCNGTAQPVTTVNI